MRVLMVGRERSIAFKDLKRYWGEVVFATPPRIPLGRYDLVVAQEPTLRVGVPAYLASRPVDAKLVIEVHGDYLPYLPAYARAVASFLLKRADYVRAVNHSIAWRLREHGVENVLVIPSIYIDLELFRPLKPHSLRPKRVIYAGRFTREKNLSMVVEAFKIVLEEVGDAVLTLVGDGPQRSFLDGLVRSLGLESFVEINRWVPRERLPEFYSDSAVFVLASRYEGGPRAVFEAGACSTPFVSTRVGILAETARHSVHGFFVDEPDPYALAEYIIKLLRDPRLRERMGGELRRFVEERFEWGKAVRRYAEAYMLVLRGEEFLGDLA